MGRPSDVRRLRRACITYPFPAHLSHHCPQLAWQQERQGGLGAATSRGPNAQARPLAEHGAGQERFQLALCSYSPGPSLTHTLWGSAELRSKASGVFLILPLCGWNTPIPREDPQPRDAEETRTRPRTAGSSSRPQVPTPGLLWARWGVSQDEGLGTRWKADAAAELCLPR